MIYEIHGAIDQVDPKKVSHRRILSMNKLINWINNKERFVSIADSLNGNGDAITIDDGIFLAYNTAKVIKINGHEISIFINGYNITRQEDYYFIRLNHILDYLTEKEVPSGIANIQEFRDQIKSKYLSALNNEECNMIVDDMSISFLGNKNNLIDSNFSICTTNHLFDLSKNGIVLGNHGWSHINYNLLNNEDFIKQFKLNEDWIYELGLSFCSEVVVPFGKLNGNKIKEIKTDKVILLADKSLPAGWLADNIYNRYSIDSDSDFENL